MHDRGSAQTLHQCIRITRPALHFAAQCNQKVLQLRGMSAAVYRRIKGPSKAALQSRKEWHAWMLSCSGMQPS